MMGEIAAIRLDYSALRARRRKLGVTQRQLAELLGVTESAVSHWEHNSRLPSSLVLFALCRVLGVPTWEVVRVVETKTDDSPETAS